MNIEIVGGLLLIFIFLFTNTLKVSKNDLIKKEPHKIIKGRKRIEQQSYAERSSDVTPSDGSNPKLYIETPTTHGLLFMLIGAFFLHIGSLFYNAIPVLGLIFLIYGYWKIFNDRNSYSEPHPTNMKLSIYFISLGIILTIIGLIIQGILFRILIDIIYFSSDIFSMSTIILRYGGAIFIMIGYFMILIELTPPDKKRFLFGTTIFSILIITNSLLIVTIFVITHFSEIFLLIEIFRSLILLSNILFVICFYFAYDFQKRYPQLNQVGPSYPPIRYPPPYYPQ